MYGLLLILASAAFASLAWRDIKLGLIALAALLPSYLLRFELFGIPSTLLEVFVMTLIIIWLIKGRYKQVRTELIRAWRLPILLLLLATTIGVLISLNTIAALGIWKTYFIEPILLFFIASAELEKNEDQKRVLAALAGSAIFIALYAIAQSFFSLPIPPPWDIEGRVTSLFPFPNAVGLFLGPITSGALIYLFTTKSIRAQNLAFFTATFGTLAIILAQSEAALVALLAVTLLYGLISKKYRIYAVGSIALLALLAALFPIHRSLAIDKLTLQDYSGGVRLAQWEDTVAFLKTEPLFGAGLSGYPSAIAPFHDEAHIEIFQYPHNVLLNFWVEIGLLGLLAIGWIAVLLLRESKTIFKKTDPISLAASAALLQMFIHGLVDVPYLKNDLAILSWLLIALLLNARYAQKTQS